MLDIVPISMYSTPMDTRERLIESMKELLWERGYVATSPKAVQRHAEAGQGSMYHHFASKHDLALEAIRRSVGEIKTMVEEKFSCCGSAYGRIEAYLLRERDILRGCPLGRLTQDPEIIANPTLRRPLDEAFVWLRTRLAEIIAEGQARGEFDDGFNAHEFASAVIATTQGGYVLAKAASSEEPFFSAVRGILNMLASHRKKKHEAR